MINSNIILSVENICKTFPGVNALKGISLNVKEGEVLGLVGENGAGKSTLVNILAGIHRPDSGVIKINDREVIIKNPIVAKQLGINVVFQEFTLAPDLNATENIFLGREIRGKAGFLNNIEMRKRAKNLLEQVGIDIDISIPIRKLRVIEQQCVEIARGLAFNSKLIIMDEPTSSLHKHEIKYLFNIIKSLKESNISIIFISHILEEILEISDRITVFRNGEVVGTYLTREMDSDKIFEKMIGSPAGEYFVKEKIKIQEPVLMVEKLVSKPKVNNITFSLQKGEILGFAGLSGAGKSELAEAIFGIRKIDSGKIWLKGKWFCPSSPVISVSLNLGLVPEDRKNCGLFLDLDIMKNITIVNLSRIIKHHIIISKEEQRQAINMINILRIKVSNLFQKVRFLSGGNQQKIVLSKWLFNKSDILILDEPTRGIDINAKKEIYRLMMDFLKKGGAIILISSELSELTSLSDRIMVLDNGEIKTELKKGQINKRILIKLMTRGGEDV